MARPSIAPHLRLNRITRTQRAFLKRIASLRSYDYTASDSESVQITKTVHTLAERGLLTDDGRYASITDAGRALAARMTGNERTPLLRLPVRASEPIVRELFDLIELKGATHKELVQNAGLHMNALQQWFRNGRSPGVSNFNAVANVLGYRLALVPMEQER